MDENYYRPSKEQLNKIVPKVTPQHKHQMMLFSFAKSYNVRIKEAEKLTKGLTDNEIFIQILQTEITGLMSEVKRLQNLLSIEIQKNKRL